MILPTEEVALDDLKPHPRNYRAHPDDQILQLAASIEQHGLYRNLVVARDGTILAGHGIAEALRRLDHDRVRVVRLDVDPEDPRALKVLAGDNETMRLAAIDDRALTELLKEVKDFDEYGLAGTGFDELMLANLVLVTRTEDEVPDINAAAEWVGVPEYKKQDLDIKLIVNFRSAADRRKFAEEHELSTGDDAKQTWKTRWPHEEKDDLKSVIFDG